jgi:preprotein translocase subunit SecY
VGAAGSLLVGAIAHLIGTRGIGLGFSVIMAANVLAAVPFVVGEVLARPDSALTLALSGFCTLVIVVAVVHFDGAYRHLSVRFEERLVGDKAYGGQSLDLPFKLLFNGYRPAFLAFVVTVLLSVVLALLGPFELIAGSVGFVLVFGALVVFFNTLMTAFDTDPSQIAADLAEAGAGLEEPSEAETESARPMQYEIDQTLLRLSIISAAFLTAVALFPRVALAFAGINSTVGGMSLLVVVLTVLRIREGSDSSPKALMNAKT